MLHSIWNFIITVPVENSILQAVIMVAEIMVVGIILYFVWELVLRLSSNLGSISVIRRKAGVRGDGHDKARQIPGTAYPEEGFVISTPASDRVEDLATGKSPLMQVSSEKGATTRNLVQGRTE